MIVRLPKMDDPIWNLGQPVVYLIVEYLSDVD